MRILNWISGHLLPLVLITAVLSFLFPAPGSVLGWIITPTLAVMVLCVSLTIKVEDLKQIRKHPFVIVWSVFLQFIPMSLFALLLGKLFVGSPDIQTGQLLLGCLPADISAPLMVYLAGGSTALATVMLVAAMCLTPFILPEILKRFGGITLNIPASYLAVELALIIVLPVVIGVLLNFFSEKVRKKENAWSGIASVCYLMLLFVVVSSNAKTVVLLKTLAVFILISEVGLNIFGYLLAYLTKIIFKQKEAFYPLLFIVGTKEFGIAAAAVETMKLNVAMVIPSAFYAVVQMILSPIMVKLLNIRKLKRSKK